MKFTLAVTYNISFGIVSHEVYPCINLKRLIGVVSHEIYHRSYLKLLVCEAAVFVRFAKL
jgi:hypothetical protein